MPNASTCNAVAILAQRREIRRKLRQRLEMVRENIAQQSSANSSGVHSSMNNSPQHQLRDEAKCLQHHLNSALIPCFHCVCCDGSAEGTEGKDLFNLQGSREKEQQSEPDGKSEVPDNKAESSFEESSSDEEDDEEEGRDDSEEGVEHQDTAVGEGVNSEVLQAEEPMEEDQGDEIGDDLPALIPEVVAHQATGHEAGDEEDDDHEDDDDDWTDLEHSSDDEDDCFGPFSRYRDEDSDDDDYKEYLVGSELSGKNYGLPGFMLHGGVAEVWEYGTEKKNGLLMDALNPFKNFYVVNKKSEDHLSQVVHLIDESVDDENCGLLRLVAFNNGAGVKELLQLGVDPDLMDFNGMRPSMVCSVFCNVHTAKAIRACRPDMTAKDFDDMTLLERAKYWANGKAWIPFNMKVMWVRRQQIVELWENAEKQGFPSLARLAFKKRWYAVQNLCRRPVVTEEEKLGTHEGKTAIEWALHYGKQMLAKEMQYLLDPLSHADVGSGGDEPNHLVQMRA